MVHLSQEGSVGVGPGAWRGQVNHRHLAGQPEKLEQCQGEARVRERSALDSQLQSKSTLTTPTCTLFTSYGHAHSRRECFPTAKKEWPWAGRAAEVVQCLPSKREARTSNLTTTKRVATHITCLQGHTSNMALWLVAPETVRGQGARHDRARQLLGSAGKWMHQGMTCSG
jgi:hypothetical protein